MSATQCAAAFNAAPVSERAAKLDEAFPNCACESWALTEAGGSGIGDHELIARVLTAPNDVDEETETIVTAKLTQMYAMGMSVIRQGASSDEIANTAQFLIDNNAGPVSLYGAAVISASQLRSYVTEEDMGRWFGVYATDDRGKTHHGDIFGTKASKGQQQKRRHRLASDMALLIVRADTPEKLVTALRQRGF